MVAKGKSHGDQGNSPHNEDKQPEFVTSALLICNLFDEQPPSLLKTLRAQLLIALECDPEADHWHKCRYDHSVGTNMEGGLLSTCGS